MNTNSNQGPPDLDEVLRHLLSFLLKKKKRRKKSRDKNPLKRLLEPDTKKRPEKMREPAPAVAKTNVDRRAQEQIQSQSSVKKEVSQTRVNTVNIENDTRRTSEQRVTNRKQTQRRPTGQIKAEKLVEKNVNADSTRERLHDPRAVRQAFVLKELLEPPIALRKRPRRRFS